MDEDYWDAVRSMRLDIADLLGSLAPEEWDAPSLCRGWRVRDVAGHVAVVPTITTWQMMSVAPRAGFDPNRINTLVAIREGSRPPEEPRRFRSSCPASGRELTGAAQGSRASRSRLRRIPQARRPGPLPRNDDSYPSEILDHGMAGSPPLLRRLPGPF